MRRLLFVIAKAGFILIFLVLGLFISQSTHKVETVSAQTTGCTTPAQVQGVSISFPYCTNGTQVGSQCINTQANCTWTALAGVTNYQVTITNATTNTQVMSQTVAGTATNQVFNVDNGNTYTCSVAGVNSCGTAGAAGTFSLLCEVEGLTEATPTVAPTSIAPTTPPPPPATGAFENTLIIGVGTVALLIGGLFLMFI